MMSKCCPWCKAEPRHLEVVTGLDREHYVRCNRCFARGPKTHISVLDAERLWDAQQDTDKSLFEQVFG